MATKTRRTSSSTGRSSSADGAAARELADPATAYARGVAEGRIIAGPHVRAACARHLRDLEEGPARGLSWHPELADRVYRYFRTVLRLNGGEHEGAAFVLLPWQQFIVGSLFGWIGPDGYRRFRVAYTETAKGSGKSPLAGGIGLYMETSDGEPRAEVYAAATKKDQAMVLFRDAVAMVQQSPALRKRIVTSGVQPVWNLAHLASGSFFRPISSEDDGQSGPRPHCALIDEIHEHKTATVVDMMRAGTKGRRQALIFMITNSGVDRQSVCYQHHEYGIKVAAGDVVDDSYFAYICAIDEGEDPLTDPPDPALGYPRSWAKANPSIGVTFAPKYLEEQVREARGMPAKESVVRRLNFCQWVDAANPWIDGDLWQACEDPQLQLPVAGGVMALDLGAKRDLVAAARAVMVGDVIHAEVRFWTPKDTLVERERIDRVPYGTWVRQGHLNAVPGRSVDYAFVVRDLAALGWLRSAEALAFDQWRIDDFQRELDDAGIDNWIWEPPTIVSGTGLCLVRHGQGFGGGLVELDERGEPAPKKTLWMPRSIHQIEERVVTNGLRVRQNPVLTWASASAVLAHDAAGNAKWEKRKSTGRIDGIVALSMAVGLLLAELERPVPQVIILGGTPAPAEEPAEPEREFFDEEEPWW